MTAVPDPQQEAREGEPATVGRPLALVTGATAGIGAAFARQLAAGNHDLVVVARDASRLTELAAELTDRYAVRAIPLPADLCTDAGCEAVEERLRAGVDLLVNNAGISLNRSFLRSTVDDETRQLRLNVEAVMRLTLAALPPMVERGRGAVINVSSVAGFGPVQPGSTYSASKAWVTNFSESVALSVRQRGVRVMALCPGYTRTEFHDRAEIDVSRLPGWAWLQPDDVVRDALRDLGKRKLVSVPNWKYKAAAIGLRYAPHGLLGIGARDPRGGSGGGTR